MIEKGMIPPMALVMPSDGLWGDGSGYCPHVGADYERWIVEEVPLAVREVLPSVDETSPCFLAGLSMGGYGALRLGAKFAERWRGISAHSAITDLEQMSLFVEEPLDFYQPQNAAERSVLYWLQKNRDRLPPLRFDCGRDDLLIEPNRQLHTALQESGIAHEYTEFEGTHHWDYWREHLRDTLGFFGEIARATPVSA
jgi:S-formylglutathione hydrolase FrmB